MKKQADRSQENLRTVQCEVTLCWSKKSDPYAEFAHNGVASYFLDLA